MFFKTTKIPVRILHIEQDGSHLFVEVEVNRQPAILLIDTGASRTVFDSSRVRNFEAKKEFRLHSKLSTGLGTNSMPTQGVVIDSFKIGKLNIEDFDVVVLDLNHVNESYASLGIPPIDGVLGNDILVPYKAIVDLSKKQLTINLNPHLL